MKHLSKKFQRYLAKKNKPVKGLPHSDYWKLWRLVDGAVKDAFLHHPDYLTEHGVQNARLSITKRTVGALIGAGSTVWKNHSFPAGERAGSPHRPERQDGPQEKQEKEEIMWYRFEKGFNGKWTVAVFPDKPLPARREDQPSMSEPAPLLDRHLHEDGRINWKAILADNPSFAEMRGAASVQSDG